MTIVFEFWNIMLKARLVQIDGAKSPRYRLEKPELLIGRSRSCDIPIDDARASRKHCRIIIEPLAVLVEDLQSRNGTFLNKRGIPKGTRVAVYHNDELRVGHSRFRFSIRDPKTRQPHERPSKMDLAITPADGYEPPSEDESIQKLFGELDSIAIHASDRALDSTDETATFVELQQILDRRTDSDGWSGQKRQPFQRGPSKPERGDEAKRQEPQSAPSGGPNSNEPASSKSGSSDSGLSDPGDRPTRDPLAAAEGLEDLTSKEKKKLPEHLRPGRTKDSQDAAREALKNLFRGGG
ncbi:MAG: FHA domain-containing protein [Planctomycetota bacterium]